MFVVKNKPEKWSKIIPKYSTSYRKWSTFSLSTLTKNVPECTCKNVPNSKTVTGTHGFSCNIDIKTNIQKTVLGAVVFNRCRTFLFRCDGSFFLCLILPLILEGFFVNFVKKAYFQGHFEKIISLSVPQIIFNVKYAASETRLRTTGLAIHTKCFFHKFTILATAKADRPALIG